MATAPGPRAALLGMALLASAFTPATAQDATNPVTIANPRYGLVCGPDDARRVCFQTSDIQLTGEGKCIFSGKPIACTWFGYEFDYTLAISKATLQCTFSENNSATFGNPKEELATDAKQMSYTIELDGSRHHYFNPQYATAVPGRPDDTITQACSYAGNNVFTVTFHEHQPDPLPKP